MLDFVSKIAYVAHKKSCEFKRWLMQQGASFSPAKGSHFRVKLNGPQDVTRLTNLRYNSKIDSIADALQALGKTLELRAV